MLELQLRDARELTLALEIISRKFGFWTTFRGLVIAALRRRQAEWEMQFLDNRTRRDIGLPEIEVQPQILWLQKWDGRL